MIKKAAQYYAEIISSVKILEIGRGSLGEYTRDKIARNLLKKLNNYEKNIPKEIEQFFPIKKGELIGITKENISKKLDCLYEII